MRKFRLNSSCAVDTKEHDEFDELLKLVNAVNINGNDNVKFVEIDNELVEIDNELAELLIELKKIKDYEDNQINDFYTLMSCITNEKDMEIFQMKKLAEIKDWIRKNRDHKSVKKNPYNDKKMGPG